MSRENSSVLVVIWFQGQTSAQQLELFALRKMALGYVLMGKFEISMCFLQIFQARLQAADSFLADCKGMILGFDDFCSQIVAEDCSCSVSNLVCIIWSCFSMSLMSFLCFHMLEFFKDICFMTDRICIFHSVVSLIARIARFKRSMVWAAFSICAFKVVIFPPRSCTNVSILFLENYCTIFVMPSLHFFSNVLSV